MATSLTVENLNQITSTIIAGAIDVHFEIGPGLFENVDLACLCHELQSRGVQYESQKPLPLIYRGVSVDCAYRVDLVVEGSVLVEVKALESLAGIHSRQLYTYLRLGDYPLGLLLNFGALTMKAGIKRIVNGFPPG
jgi:GxxExxY protein